MDPAWQSETLFIIKRLDDKSKNIESLNQACDLAWEFIRKISRFIKENNLKARPACVSWLEMLLYASMQNNSENKGFDPDEIAAVEAHLPGCEYCQHQYLILRVRDALVYVENEIWRLNKDAKIHDAIIANYMKFYRKLNQKIIDKQLSKGDSCPDVEQYMHFHEALTKKEGFPYNPQIARRVKEHLDSCEYCRMDHLVQMALFAAEDQMMVNHPATYEYYEQKQMREMLHFVKQIK